MPGIVWEMIFGGISFLFIVFLVVEKVRRKRKEDAAREAERAKWGDEANRILSERRKDQLDKLRQCRFVVSIREKDGRKSSFEAILIAALVRNQVIVEYWHESDLQTICDADATLLSSGLVALIGTSWHRSRRQEPDWHAGCESEFTYCDYRLLAADDNGNCRILAAGCDGTASHWEDPLARQIVENIAETMFPPSATAESAPATPSP